MALTATYPKLRRGLVAILRGLRPDEALDIGRAVYEAGIEAIEVPLNSPDPFTSIAALVSDLPKSALLGAGTVLTAGDVDRLAETGGKLLVSPNIDADVMHRAAHHRLVTMPGVFTPSEAFAAIKLGASALKFFPASVLGFQRHRRDQGGAAQRRNPGGCRRRVGEGLRRLCESGRLDFRTGLQPLCAGDERGGRARTGRGGCRRL